MTKKISRWSAAACRAMSAWAVVCAAAAAAGEAPMADAAAASDSNAPAFAEVTFSNAAPHVVGAAWLRGVRQEGAGFSADGLAWQAPGALPWGVGKLMLDVDRDALCVDAALTLVFEATNADFAIQLFDAHNRVLALDLFSNVADLCAQFRTDTLILPLNAYPEATTVVIRRLAGDVVVHGALLTPVATAVEERNPLTLLEMARLLGDPLSPANPLVRALRATAGDEPSEPDRLKTAEAGTHPRSSFFPVASAPGAGRSGAAPAPRDSPKVAESAAPPPTVPVPPAAAEPTAREIIGFLNNLSTKGLDFTADDFVRLAGDGELEMVNLYLKAGMPVRVRDRRGVNAAVESALKGRIKVLDLLLDAGMPVDETDTIRRTPLFAAAQQARADVIAFLVMRGADPNRVNAHGSTALWHVVYWGCDVAYAARDGLIKAGADINYRDPQGVSVLMNAVRAGHLRHVEALIANGADLKAKDNEGRTVMDYALYRGDEWVGMALERAGAGRFRLDDLPPDMRLIAAAKANDADACRSLLEAGANPNARDLEDKTALIWTAHNGCLPEMIDVLLAQGADPKLADDAGRTALIEGAIWQSEAASRALGRMIEAGADVNHQDNKGTTALMVAAHGNVTTSIQELLRRGADPGLKDKSGKTARDVASGNANELNEMILKYYRPPAKP